jgi:glycosyltransferase involved in cell wall biosynthesis
LSAREVNPAVSVIMPCRNEGARIAATLESVFSQRPPPAEIVIADGCSSDDTVAQAQRFANRGIPLKIVRNESRFSGGGRNAATKAALHDILVCMDAGNTAEPGWLRAMTEPFARDADLELLAGVFYPSAGSRLERLCGAVCYTTDVLLPTMKRADVEAMVPSDFVPGGMCMAYRRRLWERTGGFSEWARKGQDKLFGLRARRVGAKLGFTVDAAVSHHMAASLRQLASRHFFYEVWAARMRLPGRSGVLALVWAGAALVALLMGVAAPWLLLGFVPLGLLYAYVRAWRRLRKVAQATGQGFTPRENALAVVVLLVHDLACASGRLVGCVDRLVRPGWRRATGRYLEHGT